MIRAHPDLAGKAAIAGDLTDDSTREQAGAGLDQCSPEELARFERLNEAYKAKFGFPFVMAVKGSDRYAILDAFETRLENDPGAPHRGGADQSHRPLAPRGPCRGGPLSPTRPDVLPSCVAGRR